MNRIWKGSGYKVEKVEFDHELSQFLVIKNGREIGRIIPENVEDMNRIIDRLNLGEDPHGWKCLVHYKSSEYCKQNLRRLHA